MARRIRLPGFVDIVLVSDADEIRDLNNDTRVDRRFLSRGPFLNRLISHRIARWFEIDDAFLPSLAPRDDPVRLERQEKLAASLDPHRGRILWSDEQVETLASFVSGNESVENAAIAVQQIVGNLFDPHYVADRESWEAAKIIDEFRNGFSLREFFWRLTGRLGRAHRLLIERANRDRWAMHGTAIGVHGIVQALLRMRRLREGGDAASVDPETVLKDCIAPPKQVPRTVEAELSAPFVLGQMKPGTLIMLQLEAAGRRSPGSEMAFMNGHWNGCPAHAFVTGLLGSVWVRSRRTSAM